MSENNVSNEEKPYYRVIVIEDHSEVREMLTEVIGELDVSFKPFTAADGLEGLKYFAQLLPDLVILDIMLPKMNGFQFLESVRKHKQFLHIPIIVMSALSEPTDVKKAIELGATDYMRKPVELDSLEQKINRVMPIIKKYHKPFVYNVINKDHVINVQLVGKSNEKRMKTVKDKIMESVQDKKVPRHCFLLDMQFLIEETLGSDDLSLLFDFYGDISKIDPEDVIIFSKRESLNKVIKSHVIAKHFQIMNDIDEAFKYLNQRKNRR